MYETISLRELKLSQQCSYLVAELKHSLCAALSSDLHLLFERKWYVKADKTRIFFQSCFRCALDIWQE
jgi:hypothetical protein